MLIELLVTSAAIRALVVGLLGAAGLVALTVCSRRGPLVFPVYAAAAGFLLAVGAVASAGMVPRRPQC